MPQKSKQKNSGNTLDSKALEVARGMQLPWLENSHRTPSAASPFHQYLNEICRTPLLDEKEESALARRVQQGDPRARDQMICANLRLVVKIARDYENFAVPLLDLISEGNIGLVKAVERFDPEKGAKLSTYAAWWIKHTIRRALVRQGKTVRLSQSAASRVHRIRRAEIQLRQELGHDPTDRELANELAMKEWMVKRYRQLAVNLVSLDASSSDEEDTVLLERVKNENTPEPDHSLVRKNNAAQVQELIKHLKPREKKIVESRFGLKDGESKTLEEIGLQFGITRERIRQIQNGALEKMRCLLRKKEPELFPAPWPGAAIGRQ